MNLELASADQLVPELEAPPLVARRPPLHELTAREGQVLTLIARGYSNAAIAEAFTISDGTVKTHVKHVLAKLGVNDRTQAAIYAYEMRFVVVASSQQRRSTHPTRRSTRAIERRHPASNQLAVA